MNGADSNPLHISRSETSSVKFELELSDHCRDADSDSDSDSDSSCGYDGRSQRLAPLSELYIL